MGVGYNPKIVTNSLTWALDARNIKSYPGSGTTWFDLTSGGKNGTLTNTPIYSGDYFTLDGTNYILVSSLGSMSAQGTIEFWMYPTIVENFRNPFSTHYNSGNAGFRWEMNSSSNFYIVIGNEDGTSAAVYNYAASLTANKWYHVSITWDTTSSAATGYLDGVQVFNTTTHTYWATTLPSIALGVGYLISLAPRFFKGRISNAKIYSKRLSADEILQTFNALRGRFGV
jgi:hypothetical protein